MSVARRFGAYVVALLLSVTTTGQEVNEEGIRLYQAGDLDEALKSFEEQLASLKLRHGDAPHPDVVTCLCNLGLVLQTLRRPGNAVEVLEEAVEMQEALPPSPLDLAAVLNNLGCALDDQGRHEEARSALKKSLAIRTINLDPQDLALAYSCINLGLLPEAPGSV